MPPRVYFPVKDKKTGREYQMPWDGPDKPDTDSVRQYMWDQENKSTWDKLNEPLTDLPSRIASKADTWLNPVDSGDDSYWSAATKGFLGGATQGAGDVLSSFSSPMNLGMSALTGGAAGAARSGAMGAARGLTTTARALGGAQAAHGGGQMYGAVDEAVGTDKPFSWDKFGAGAMEATGGLLGMNTPYPKGPITPGMPPPRPQLPPQKGIGPGGGLARQIPDQPRPPTPSPWMEGDFTVDPQAFPPKQLGPDPGGNVLPPAQRVFTGPQTLAPTPNRDIIPQSSPYGMNYMQKGGMEPPTPQPQIHKQPPLQSTTLPASVVPEAPVAPPQSMTPPKERPMMRMRDGDIEFLAKMGDEEAMAEAALRPTLIEKVKARALDPTATPEPVIPKVAPVKQSNEDFINELKGMVKPKGQVIPEATPPPIQELAPPPVKAVPPPVLEAPPPPPVIEAPPIRPPVQEPPPQGLAPIDAPPLPIKPPIQEVIAPKLEDIDVAPKASPSEQLPKTPKTRSQVWKSQAKQLEANNAPDELYRDLLPKEAQTKLAEGETWKDKVNKYIKADEYLAREKAKDKKKLGNISERPIGSVAEQELEAKIAANEAKLADYEGRRQAPRLVKKGIPDIDDPNFRNAQGRTRAQQDFLDSQNSKKKIENKEEGLQASRVAPGRYDEGDVIVEKTPDGWRWSKKDDPSSGGEWRSSRKEAMLDLEDYRKNNKEEGLQGSRVIPEFAPTGDQGILTVQGARTGEGKLAIGADIKSLGKVLGTSLYKGDIATIATKELVQNSLDAIRHLGPKGKIDIKFHEKEHSLEVIDNGKGLTRNEIETIFTDLGSSGKRDDDAAIGGFGLAKAAPLLGGKKVHVITTAMDKGRMYTTEFIGTPDELLEGVDIKQTEVAIDTPTGTQVKVFVPESSYFGTAGGFIDSTKKYSNIEGTIRKGSNYTKDPWSDEKNFDLNSFDEENKFNTEMGLPLNKRPVVKHIATVKNKSGNVDIGIAPGAHIGEETQIDIVVLNKGMYQHRRPMYLGQKVDGIPNRLVVNIDAIVPEGHPDYPFTANREELRGSIDEAVTKYVEEHIIKPAKQKGTKELQKLYDDMPSFKGGDGKDIHYHDTGQRYTPKEIRALVNSKVMMDLGSQIDDNVRSALAKIGNQKWDDRLERVGFIFDDGLKGIHIPNPATGKSAILINPLLLMSKRAPDEAAAGFIHTILHEIGHIEPDNAGHSETFTVRLSDIYEKYGARATVNAQDKFVRSVTDRQGNYTDKVQTILSEYNGSRRRVVAQEDPLTRTGIGSKATEVGSEGISSSDKPSGGRSFIDRLKSEKGAIDLGSVKRTLKSMGKSREGKSWKEVGEDIGKSNLTIVKESGAAGKKLHDVTVKTRLDADQHAGQLNVPIKKLVAAMSEAEEANFIDVLDGKGRPVSKKVQEAVDFYRKQNRGLTDDMTAAGAGLKRGKRIVPFAPMKDHFPHKYPPEFFKDKKGAMNSLIAEGHSIREAQKIIDSAGEYGERLISPQHGRQSNAPGYRKDVNVLYNHNNEMTQRIHEARNFGPLDTADAGSPISRMIAATDDPARIGRIFEKHLGRGDKPSQAWSQVVNRIAMIETATKLSNFVISNVANTAMIPLRGNVVETVKALGRIIANPKLTNEQAEMMGAHQAVYKDLVKDIGGSRGLSKWYGITASEKLNRTWAAQAGSGTAVSDFKILKKDPTNPRARKRLHRLVVEPVENLLKQDKLTQQQINRAGAKLAEDSQGRADNIDLPNMFSYHPSIKLLTLFKRFAFTQSKNIYDAIKEDPVKTLPIILGLFPLFGEGVGDVKAVIKGATRAVARGEDPMEEIEKQVGKERGVGFDRYVNNLSQAWALGLVGDALGTSQRMTGPAEFVGGAVLSDIGKTGFNLSNTIGDIGEGELTGKGIKGFSKQGAQMVPFVGSGLSTALSEDRKVSRTKNRKRKPRRD